MNKKGFIPVVFLVIAAGVLVLGAGATYYFEKTSKNQAPEKTPAQVASSSLETASSTETVKTTSTPKIVPTSTTQKAKNSQAPNNFVLDGMIIFSQTPAQALSYQERTQTQQNLYSPTYPPSGNLYSPTYQNWITPEEYDQKFGPSEAAIQKTTAWLTKQSFKFKYERGPFLNFSATVDQVEKSFGIQIQTLVVNQHTCSREIALKVPNELSSVIKNIGINETCFPVGTPV